MKKHNEDLGKLKVTQAREELNMVLSNYEEVKKER